MIKEFMKKALIEDIGRGDLFTLVGENNDCTAKVITKTDGVFAGEPYVVALCELMNLTPDFLHKDGDTIKKNEILFTLKGKTHTILSTERTLLNTIQHASGIATNVRGYVDALKGYKTKLLDTRKTRPNLRIFEKYAARIGGATNHRMGLDDALMIKDTHLKTLHLPLKEFITLAKQKIPFTSQIEIECENLDMAKEAMECGANIVMCDNMKIEEIEKVVAYRDKEYKQTLVEASGNITKENIAEYAKAGVDAISSGSLIHQAVWLDFSMKIE